MIDYQIVVNLVCFIMAISFPIALIFMIIQKIIGSFIGVCFGKNISF